MGNVQACGQPCFRVAANLGISHAAGMLESPDFSGVSRKDQGLEHELIAAVDLGSNSFRLQVGQVRGNQIYELDGIKETVRLGAGLGSDKQLDGASQLRVLSALSRFGERLRGFPPDAVRAVQAP